MHVSLASIPLATRQTADRIVFVDGPTWDRFPHWLKERLKGAEFEKRGFSGLILGGCRTLYVLVHSL